MDLPYKPIPKTEWVEVRRLMIRVAKMIDHYRCGHSRVRFRVELTRRLDDAPVEVFGILIPPEAVSDFRLLKSMEWEVAFSYSRLVESVLKKWNPKEFSTYLDADDVRHEGTLALLDAVYNYKGRNKTGKRVKFITYAQRVLERRMGRVINRTLTNHLHRPDYMVDLVAKYETIKRSFNGPVTFDEIADKLELTPRRRKLLAETLVSVLQERETNPEAVGIIGLDHVAEPTVRARLESDEREKLARIMDQLTPFQQAVIEGCMNGGYGWQSKVAAEHINPKTGTPYTRAAPNVALQQIQKLLEVA